MMLAPTLVILALVAGVPYIDIRKTCRAAQATGISIDQKAAYEGCVADETEAKQTLIKTWPRLSRANRQSCVDESTGMSPSYVEMLTCLEMRDGGKFTGGAAPAVPPPATPTAPGTGGTPASPSVGPAGGTPAAPSAPGTGTTDATPAGSTPSVPLPSSTTGTPGAGTGAAAK